MVRRIALLLLVGGVAGGVACSHATDDSSRSDDSESANAPAPGEGKQDSTTRETNIEGPIQFGKDVQGDFRDEYVGYTFDLSGEATISARVVSDDADPAIWLYGPRESDGDWGFDVADNDDISYDNENAAIRDEELEEAGTYLVVTGTEEWGESRGSYSLRVECSGSGCSGSANPDDDPSDNQCDRGGPGAGERDLEEGYADFWVNTRTCDSDVCSSNVTMGPSCAKIQLERADGDIATTAYTNIRGSVQFTDVPDGEYVVKVPGPEGEVTTMMTEKEYRFGYPGRAPAERRVIVDGSDVEWSTATGDTHSAPVRFYLEKEGHERLQTGNCCYSR